LIKYPGLKSKYTDISKTISVVIGVTVKVEVEFTLEQTTKAHRGSRGIALLFL